MDIQQPFVRAFFWKARRARLAPLQSQLRVGLPNRPVN
jgi:hypothetical protein